MSSTIELQDVLDYGQMSLDSTAAAKSMSAIFTSTVGELQAWLRRPLGVRSFTETIRKEGYDDYLAFTNTPVHSVESVEVNGFLQDRLTFDIASFGLDNMGPLLTSPGESTMFKVTYTAGIDLELWPGLTGLISRVVIAEYWRSNPSTLELTRGGVVDRISTDGGYSIGFGQDGTARGIGAAPNGAAARVGIFPPGSLVPYESLRRRT